MNQQLTNIDSIEKRQLIEKEMKYLKRDMQRQLDFETKLDNTRRELEREYMHYTETVIRNIISYINNNGQALIDVTFKSFTNKIIKMSSDYTSVNKKLHKSAPAKDLIKVIHAITNRMRECFVRIVRHYVSRYTDDELVRDITRFNQVYEFMNMVYDKCDELYDLMVDLVQSEIEQFAEEKMDSDELVYSYVEKLMTQIQSLFVQDIMFRDILMTN